MPDYEVKHTTYEEQQRFKALPPEERDLQTYIQARKTNGSVALAMRQIAELRVQFADAKLDLEAQVESHDKRLIKLERWQIGVAAIMAFIIAASAPFFWFIDRILFR